MNNIKDYITEKFKLSSKNINNINKYNYHPQNNKELKQLVDQLIKERGLDADLNDIDTSKIDDMGRLFYKSEFNGDISQWDVSNVKNMFAMFLCSKFNGDISNWDIRNLAYSNNMFRNSEFNRKEDLEKWNTNKLQYMTNMFKSSPLEKNPPSWYHE